MYTQTIMTQMHTIGATCQKREYLMCVGGIIDGIGTLPCVITEIKAIYDEFRYTTGATRDIHRYNARDTMCLFCDEFLRYEIVIAVVSIPSLIVLVLKLLVLNP